MKFEFYKGLIWISVGIEYEGKPVKIDKCILDTGSATTAIDKDFVDFNYDKTAFIRRLCGLGGGTQEVICQKTDRFLIDKAEVKDIEIEFGDIQSGFGINGFVGNDILSRFSFSIDFFKQEIETPLAGSSLGLI